MKWLLYIYLFSTIQYLYAQSSEVKIFDVHLHGDSKPLEQIENLKTKGVYKIAISTSWKLQETYLSDDQMEVLKGLMLGCPNGKVPYSGQFCFDNEKDFPEVEWVEKQIQNKKIDYIGEVLSQYYGVSPSDSLFYPYYKLAEKYKIPVGIHTGLAGPGHGAPNFKVSLGNPILIEDLLKEFPDLKVWIMHAGAPFLQETLALMTYYPNVYADISVISNPYIFKPVEFQQILKRFLDAGLENKLMFGTDNGPLDKIMENLEAIDFLTIEQKEKIYFKNAENFFSN